MFAAFACLGDPLNCFLSLPLWMATAPWWWVPVGIAMGFLWGRFKLVGLLGGIALVAWLLGRFRKDNPIEKPHKDSPKPKRRGLFSRFRNRK